jgi:Arylsulfotransferase (ASST)
MAVAEANLQRLRRAAAAGVAAAALVACAMLATAPAAAQQAAPTEVISPLPGTPDANPATQISFLGAPASRLRDIVVTGSESGRHAGRLRYYSTHTGGSFLPAHPFTPGEHVTVTALLRGYGASERIGTSFEVSHPYRLPPDPPRARVPVTATNVMRFHSRHDLEPAAVTVTTPASDPSLGDIFLTPANGPGQAGTMIVSPAGKLVWFRPLPWGKKAFNLQLQSYRGAPVLTWWQGTVVEGHGQGMDVIESDRYTPIATVRAGNGLYADLHDFRLTPAGTAWITAFAPQRLNLAPVGGLPNGLVDDGVVQEIDVKTGLVMFEWHAFGHVALNDSYTRVTKFHKIVFDYFHINSLDPLADGTLLVSSRNTWAVYLISETTGQVLWRLGGKQSSFQLGPNVQFAWQHDAQVRPDGTISLFNNEATPTEAPQSSALDIAIDTSAHTATLLHSYTYPGRRRILSRSQGDIQLLSNGDSFVGWGQIGEASEFSPNGTMTFDMHLAPPTSSYRALRVAWHAEPVTQPELALGRPAHGAIELYASWNGATDVAGWRVLAGASRSKLSAVGTYPASGFETAMLARTTAPYLRVQALSANGALLRSSPIVRG